MYLDREKLIALLKWYRQEIGDELIAALIVDREGMLVESLSRDPGKSEDKKFIGAFSSLVQLILQKITTDFELGTFGAGTFDTDRYRFIFCEAGPDLVFVTVLNSMAMVDPYFPYAYLTAEKIARIFDGRPVSPVIPRLYPEKGKEIIKRKVDTLQKIQFHSEEYAYKVVFGGEGGVGKTSVILRFSENMFRVDYKATIGTYITKKECDFKELNSKVRLVIWDIAGQEQFKRMRKVYLKNAEAAIIVFDITNRTSFERAEEWYQDILDYAAPGVIAVLVGNKIDLGELREVTREEGIEKAKKLGITYIETSAKTGDNIDEAFKLLALQIIRKYVKTKEIDNISIGDEMKLKKKIDIQESKIYQLKKTNIGKVWKSKAFFISWLAKNFEYLNETLTMNLQPRKINLSRENGMIDILAYDSNGERAIVEIQEGISEPYHLANMIINAASQKAKILIWICENVTFSHKEAIEWLNEILSEDILLYILQINIFINTRGRPIPKFIKVSGPGISQAQTAEDEVNIYSKEHKRIKFWEGLIKTINENKQEKEDFNYHKSILTYKNAGISGINYTFKVKDDWSAVQVNFNAEDKELNERRFLALENKKAEINNKFSEMALHMTNDLIWDFKRGRSHQQIMYKFENKGLSNDNKYNVIYYMLLDAIKLLINVFEHYIEEIN